MPQLLFKHHCHFLPYIITKFIFVLVCIYILLSWGPGLLMRGEHGCKTCYTGPQCAGLTQTNMCIPQGDLGPQIHLICIFELLSSQSKRKENKQRTNIHRVTHQVCLKTCLCNTSERADLNPGINNLCIIPRFQDMS